MACSVFRQLLVLHERCRQRLLDVKVLAVVVSNYFVFEFLELFGRCPFHSHSEEWRGWEKEIVVVSPVASISDERITSFFQSVVQKGVWEKVCCRSTRQQGVVSVCDTKNILPSYSKITNRQNTRRKQSCA